MHGGIQVEAEMRSKAHNGAVVCVERWRTTGMVPTPSPSPLRLLVLTSWSSQWMVNMSRTVM